MDKIIHLYVNQYFGANDCVEEARKFVSRHSLTGYKAVFVRQDGQIFQLPLEVIPQVAFEAIKDDKYVGWYRHPIE